MKTTVKLFSAFVLGALAACSGMADVPEVTPAGAYVLDKAAMKESMLAAMPEAAKSQPQATKMLDEMVDGMNVSMDLGVDGSIALTMAMSMLGQVQKSSAKGTWTLEGDKLTMVTTNDRGQQETKVAQFVDGSIVVEESNGGQKMKMTFVRK